MSLLQRCNTVQLERKFTFKHLWVFFKDAIRCNLNVKTRRHFIYIYIYLQKRSFVAFFYASNAVFCTNILKTEQWGVHRPAGNECDGQLDWNTRRSRARVLVVKATCLASQLCFPALEHPMQIYQWSWSRNCGKSCHCRASREPFGSILRQRLFGRAQIGDLHVFAEKGGILCVWLPAEAIQSFPKIGRILTYQSRFDWFDVVDTFDI